MLDVNINIGNLEIKAIKIPFIKFFKNKLYCKKIKLRQSFISLLNPILLVHTNGKQRENGSYLYFKKESPIMLFNNIIEPVYSGDKLISCVDGYEIIEDVCCVEKNNYNKLIDDINSGNHDKQIKKYLKQKTK